MTDAVAFRSTTDKSNVKISIEDLNFALLHGEKLEKLPDKIEVNVVYRLALASNIKDAYKYDHYSWKNTRSIQYPKNNPKFMKIYYYCINSEKKKDGRCVKHIYISITNDFDVLVSYHGNLDIATKHPHGNCKLMNAHVLHHTPQSTIQQIDQLVSKMSGAAAYKTLVAANGGIDSPRNASQCNYRRQKYLNNQKISHDELSNVILLSYELNEFYKLLQLQPETLIILMHDQMKSQLLNLLRITKEIVPLYYETTFFLGEIYVSILGFRNVIFSERPILPLAILMHDRKLQSGHERFVQILNNELPNLHKNCILVTDGEDALKNAFRKYYPRMLQLRCWNHAMNDIKAAAKKYFFIEQQKNVVADADAQMNRKEIIDGVIDAIKTLLRASSYNEFRVQYENISLHWPKRFVEYFEKNTLPIINELGGWSGRMFQLFDEVSGVKNNPIESLNAVFKRWLSWKELSLYALVQMFFFVLEFYVNEFRRSLCSYGMYTSCRSVLAFFLERVFCWFLFIICGYHLQAAYNDAKTDVAHLTLVSGFSPDEVVAKIKSAMLKQPTPANDDNPAFGSTQNQAGIINLNDMKDDSDNNNSIEVMCNNESIINRPLSNNQTYINDIRQEKLTNTSRASLLLEQNLVQYHADTKVFTVRSLDHLLVHAVHMNDPKRLFRCSCPNTLLNCSHVLAVKQFLGMSLDKRDNHVNLGHERKRKRIDDKIKKVGGKCPRRCDKESNQKYTSSHFSSKQNNATNAVETRRDDIISFPLNPSNNPQFVTRTLTDISNLPSSSTSNVTTTPKVIKAIRFITPVNLIVSQQQSNQAEIYSDECLLDELYSKVKQAYVDVNIPAVYPTANKQLQQRLSDFVSKEEFIVLPIDDEIKVVVSSFIHAYEQTGFIESAPKCYERLHNIYAISNKRIRIVQRTLAKFIVSSFVNDENENEKNEDDKSRDDKIESGKGSDDKIESGKGSDETIEGDTSQNDKIKYDKSYDDKIKYDKSHDDKIEDDKKYYKQHRNVLKFNQSENVHISPHSTSHVSINTRSKTKLSKDQNIRSSERDLEADKRKKMKR
ncbi:unnamed protein product [Rotaria sp. Silwood1]|nr:unnamed protein product [Rotaria sp. Silwood1]